MIAAPARASAPRLGGEKAEALRDTMQRRAKPHLVNIKGATFIEVHDQGLGIS